MKTKLTIIAIFSMLLAHSAVAEVKKVTLNYYGSKFTGNSTLKLKQKLNQQYPYLNMSGAKLINAKLVAKTKFGNGKARLKVGGSVSGSQIVDGHPGDFPGNSDYSSNYFSNPNWNSNGVWQFKLKGKFKVRKVKLKIKFPNNGGGAKSCTYVLETIWGTDIKDFKAYGPTKYIACKKAEDKCEDSEEASELSEALLQCSKK